MRIFLPWFLAAALSACASLNETQCRAGDWEAYGRVDGEKGYPAEYWREHQGACRQYGVAVDTAAYLRAREAGLKSYCTPESGYRAGRAGEGYYDVCEGSAARDFKAQYSIGQRYHRAATRKREVEEELSKTKPDTSVADVLGLTAESNRRHELMARQGQLDDEMQRSDALAPTPNWQRATLGPASFSDGFGALTGTFIGFGTGHALQGRYFDGGGWLFTLTQVAGIAALATVPNACGGANTCRAFAVSVPFVAFLASKIWESADVWRFFGWRMQGYPHLTASSR